MFQAPPGVRGIDESSGAATLNARKGNRVTHKGRVDGPNAESGALTLYATLSGQPADDNNNLLQFLANGLDEPPPGKDANVKFLAKHFLPESKTERPVDLSLFTWMLFGQDRVLHASEGIQTTKLELGTIDRSMICASRDGTFAPRPPAIDLLPSWQKFTPGGLSIQRTAYGVRFTRPHGVNQGIFSAGELIPYPIDRTNKTLLMEVVAIKPGNGKLPFRFLIQPGDNFLQATKDNPIGGQFSTKWNVAREVPWNSIKRFAIELDRIPDSKLMTTISISADPQQIDAWPQEATLAVTKLLLSENDDSRIAQWLKPGPTDTFKDVDVVSRWWTGDVLREDVAAGVTAKREISPKQRLFHMEIPSAQSGKDAGSGGPLYPPVLVDSASHELQVIIKSFTPSQEGHKSKLTVWMEASDDAPSDSKKAILAKTISLDEIKLNKPFTIHMTKSGFANYFALLTDAAAIDFVSIAVVAKPK